jgi:hypothetical protein
MKTVFARSPSAPQLEDDTFVPEELIGRLHRATETTVVDLLDRFTTQERANLAMFCYHKTHLHRIGLVIAATCDRASLVQQLGTVLGQALYAQSRDIAAASNPVRVHHRPKVTLAQSAGDRWPPLVDIEDAPLQAPLAEIENKIGDALLEA